MTVIQRNPLSIVGVIDDLWQVLDKGCVGYSSRTNHQGRGEIGCHTFPDFALNWLVGLSMVLHALILVEVRLGHSQYP